MSSPTKGKTSPVGPTKWAPATGPLSKPGESSTPATRVIVGGTTEKEIFHTAQRLEAAAYTSVPRTAISRSWAPSALTAGRQSHWLGCAAWRVATGGGTLNAGGGPAGRAAHARRRGRVAAG